MQIHVARDGKELGSFSSDELRTGLESGKFRPTDFGWMEGQSDWVRLSSLPALAPAAASPEPASPQASDAPSDLDNSESALDNTARRAPGRSAWSLAKGPARPTPSLAVASLILGVLSLSAIPLLPSIPAIVCGHLARSRIKQSAGELAGEAVALGGLITGYLSLFLFGVIGAIILFVATGKTHL